MTTALDFRNQQYKGSMGELMNPELNRNYLTPRSVSRIGISSDALEYIERNRGSLALWDKCNEPPPVQQTLVSSARQPRILGKAGLRNMERSRQGSMADVLDTSRNENFQNTMPQPRLATHEAEQIACKHKGVSMQMRLEQQNEAQPPTFRPMTKSRSEMSLVMDSNSCGRASSSTAHTSIPPPRVKPEARMIAEASRGTSCSLALQGKLEGDARPVIRVKEDALENQRLGTRGSITAQQYDYAGACNPAPHAAPRIRGTRGEDNAQHGQRGSYTNPLVSKDKAPVTVKPPTRVNGAGKRYEKKNRGTIGEFLKLRYK